MFHHVAITVRSIEVARVFYEKFGLQTVHEWSADDGSVKIVQMKLGSMQLELFEYASNRNAEKLQMKRANNLEDLGVKHLGFVVDDIEETLAELQQQGVAPIDQDITNGKTGIKYFFVEDPDGMWVEIVEDKRGY